MKYRFTLFVLSFLLSVMSIAQSATPVSGVVFQDTNRNGVRDVNEKGLSQVQVSNGRDIVTTNKEGKYILPVNGDANIFVIKPRGYSFLMNEHNQYKFFFIHRPMGSPKMSFPTISPTKIPASLDFGLIPNPTESNNLRILLLGDPQVVSSTLKYFANDVVPELIGTKADFMVTLGDNVDETLDQLEPIADIIKEIGVPWRPAPGNNDLNFDTLGDKYSLETYIKNYGPQYYSFNEGPAHFIVLDDVRWVRESMAKNGYYDSALGEDQMAFLKNDLANVPKDRLIVFFMHIPINQIAEKERFFDLIKDRPHTLSVAGHYHTQSDVFLTEQQSWKGAAPHHLHIQVAACGGRWDGINDEYGFPCARPSDGTPNGYSFLDINGNDYKIKYFPSRKPADFQMSVWTPLEMTTQESDAGFVYSNIFAGNEKTKVTMTLDNAIALTPVKTVEPDPQMMQQQNWEKGINSELIKNVFMASNCQHLWKAALPKGLKPGYHRVTVKATDMYGFTFTGNHFFKIIEPGKTK